MKIIAFPFAGGNKYAYTFLNALLAPLDISMDVLEYPGRGDRIKESFCTSIEAILEDLFPQVLQTISEEEDYIIYGHSMGALVAYLVCKKIEESSVRNPKKLVVSGRKAPGVIKTNKIGQLPSQEFWKELMKLGGIPKEIEHETVLKDFFESILRSDISIVENYEHDVSSGKPLQTPIDVQYGSEELENESDFEDWKQETISVARLKEFSGNHFFIYEHAQDIIDHFRTPFQIVTQG